MRFDAASVTASYVALGRALAHVRGVPKGFDDPFAHTLLSPELRSVVERRWPRSLAGALRLVVGWASARLMGTRTMVIDQALAHRPPAGQVVLVGAGLDSRAHRLECLRGCAVFEVDHPATQAVKRARVRTLPLVASSVRYVAVDLASRSLDEALRLAGHRVDVPTCWVWEGVITYLTRAQVEQTLKVMSHRSAGHSRLVATYNEPGLARRVVSAVTGLSGEPHRTCLKSEVMAAILRSHGYRVIDDTDGLGRAARLGVRPGPVEFLWTRGHHVVVADFGLPAREACIL